jgi:hypothetical protein
LGLAQMIAPCQEERACADHDECLTQATTAVNQHFRPTSEAKSVLAEHFSVLKEHFSVVKEENLLLVSGRPPVFERNRTQKEHISLQMEQKGALRQGISAPAEANSVSLLPKLLYRLGREPKAGEYAALLQRSGYEVERVIPTGAMFSVIEAARR